MKITVAIPTYNNLKDLKRALESVFMQDFEDYEIVITDDSKNNETEDYIKSLNNPKIRYFHNIPSLGPSKNWNYMIEQSKGEYIKILFDDDWFLTNDTLGKIVKIMDEHPESDFGYCRQIGFKPGTNKVVHRRAQKYVKRLQKDPMELLLANRISAPSVVIFKKTFPVRFDENMLYANDTDFYIKALLHNKNIAFVNEELIALGCGGPQITELCRQNINLVVEDCFCLYNKYTSLIEKSKYCNKIKRKIIKMLKNFNIETLENLDTLLQTEVAVPDFVVKYYTKKSQNLGAKIRMVIEFLTGGGFVRVSVGFADTIHPFINFLFLPPHSGTGAALPAITVSSPLMGEGGWGCLRERETNPRQIRWKGAYAN